MYVQSVKKYCLRYRITTEIYLDILYVKKYCDWEPIRTPTFYASIKYIVLIALVE